MITEFLTTPFFQYRNYELTPLRLLIIVGILLGAKLLISSIGRLLQRGVFRQKNIDEGRKQGVIQLYTYAIYLLTGLAILQTLGVQIGLLVAGSAALLVGVGLGLQQTFNDFIAGIILLFEGTLEVGDIVEVDKTIGRIVRIRLRASEMVTREGVEWIIPNSKFINANIINWSHNHPQNEFSIKVSVAYEADPQRVVNLLTQCAQQHKYVANLPQPTVELSDFGDSGLVYELNFWSQNTWDIDQVKSDIRFAILKTFGEHAIEIPYPQRVIRNKEG